MLRTLRTRMLQALLRNVRITLGHPVLCETNCDLATPPPRNESSVKDQISNEEFKLKFDLAWRTTWYGRMQTH